MVPAIAVAIDALLYAITAPVIAEGRDGRLTEPDRMVTNPRRSCLTPEFDCTRAISGAVPPLVPSGLQVDVFSTCTTASPPAREGESDVVTGEQDETGIDGILRPVEGFRERDSG